MERTRASAAGSLSARQPARPLASHGALPAACRLRATHPRACTALPAHRRPLLPPHIPPPCLQWNYVLETEGAAGTDDDNAYRVVEATAATYSGREVTVVTLTVPARVKARLQVRGGPEERARAPPLLRLAGARARCRPLEGVRDTKQRCRRHGRPQLACPPRRPPAASPAHARVDCRRPRAQGRDALPSERYLKLIREGAVEYGLTEDYRAWLGTLRAYKAETRRQKVRGQGGRRDTGGVREGELPLPRARCRARAALRPPPASPPLSPPQLGAYIFGGFAFVAIFPVWAFTRVLRRFTGSKPGTQDRLSR